MQVMLRSLTKTATIDEVEAMAIIAEWQSALSALESDITTWAEERGWKVSCEEIAIDEEAFPFSYKVTALTIETDQGRIVIEPIARWVYGVKGRVDLYAYPSFHRVKMLYSAYTESEGQWTVRTDSGIDWPEPWGKTAFYNLAQGLLRRN
jgi:hypothetical protein